MKLAILVCMLMAVCIDLSVELGLRHINCRLPVMPLEDCKKWFYSMENEMCTHILKQDTCGIGANAFHAEECQAICGKYRPNANSEFPPARPPACSERVDFKECRRQYFDADLDRCEHFGGRGLVCATGLNSWDRWNGENCRLCIRGPTCRPDLIEQPCGGYQASLDQNGTFVECVPLSKGICSHETDNRFATEDECLQKCDTETMVPDCKGPMTVGECRTTYYDAEDDSCVRTGNGICVYGYNAFHNVTQCEHCILDPDYETR